MKDQQMKEMIDNLKKEYDNMPTKSSSSQIMSQLIKEKRPRWGSFFHKWQMAAMIVLALGIGGVLTMGQLNDFGSISKDEMSQAVEPKMAQDSMVENESEEADAEINTFNQPAESNEATDNRIFDDESVRSEVIAIEGMEETIQVKTLSDDALNFSTIVDERYEVEAVESGGERSLQVYANYTGERIEPFFFRVTGHEISNDSVAELESLLRKEYTTSKLGYTERKSEHFFEQHETELHVVSELSFEAPESIIYVGIVEESNKYYTITVHFIGEMYERIGADTAMMLKQARFAN